MFPTAKPTTNIQWNAIQNGANNNSLINQLYANKPATQSPSVTAASSAVKSPTAPVSAPIAPATSQNNSVSTPSTINPNQNLVTPQASPLMPPTPPASSSAPLSATFGGIVNNLANASQSGSIAAQSATDQLAKTSAAGSPLAQNTASQLAATSAAGSPQAQQYAAQTAAAGQGNANLGAAAASIGNNYGGQINDAQKSINLQEAANASSGAPVGLGRAGLIGQYGGQYLTGLSDAENAALAGNAQQLTAQNQEANALNEAAGQANTGQANIQSGLANAGNLANTGQSNVQSGLENAGSLANAQQSNVQSGLQSAASLAQPSQAAFGQTTFNPLTGQYEGNSGLPASTLQDYAQMAANGQYSAIPSSVTSNIALSDQINQAAKAINPNYNPITSAAQGAANASNVQTSGTTPTNTAASGYTQAVQTYQNMNTVYQTANGQSTNLLNDLANTGVNSSNSQNYNAAINSLANKLGSTAITKINTDIQELQNTYSNLLSTGGGTPTGQEQQALSILNPSSSAAQITQAVQSLQQAAYPKLLAQYQQAQSYQSSLGNSGNASGQSNSSGGFQEGQKSADGSLVYKNGQWTVNQ